MRTRLGAVGGGIVAIGTKELRGRMRGPRAFVGLTLYLALLAGFTVMIYLLQRDAAASQAAFGWGNPYLAAQVGQAVFATLLLLQVLLVVFLAPAATAGAISLEREKQTLDLLAATPVSTLAIVVGKLVSALAFVVVLILASIPLTAVVFVLGGVAPEDVLRGYVVLLVTAVGFGSVGLLLSTMTRRTQSATVLTYVVVLALTAGTGFSWFFWDRMAGPPQAVPVARDLDGAVGGQETSDPARIPRPPEALLWLNPFVAAADVICGTDANPYSAACGLVAAVTGTTPGANAVDGPLPPMNGGDGGPPPPGLVDDVMAPLVGRGMDLAAVTEPFVASSTRDAYWPRSAVAWLVTSAVLVLAAVQLVSPTRRWPIFRRSPRGGV